MAKTTVLSGLSAEIITNNDCDDGYPVKLKTAAALVKDDIKNDNRNNSIDDRKNNKIAS